MKRTIPSTLPRVAVKGATATLSLHFGEVGSFLFATVNGRQHHRAAVTNICHNLSYGCMMERLSAKNPDRCY